MKVSLHEICRDGDVLLDLFIYHPKHERVSAETQEPSCDNKSPDPDVVLQLVRIRVSSSELNCHPAFAELVEEYASSGESSLGPTEIPLKDDDPTAMLLLMYIIHGKITRAPFVDNNSLSELAILLHKYGVQSRRLKTCYNEWRRVASVLNPRNITSMLLYTCLSWLFQDEYTFFDVSKKLILESSGPLITDLPIPLRILDRIDQKRQLLIRTILDQLKQFTALIHEEKAERTGTESQVSRSSGKQPIQDLGVPPKQLCSTECDARLRSGFARGLRAVGLDRAPEMLYNRISANDLIGRLRNMPLPTCSNREETIKSDGTRPQMFPYDVPNFCFTPHRSRDGRGCGGDAINTLAAMLDAAVKSCDGLWLEEFTN